MKSEIIIGPKSPLKYTEVSDQESLKTLKRKRCRESVRKRVHPMNMYEGGSRGGNDPPGAEGACKWKFQIKIAQILT